MLKTMKLLIFYRPNSEHARPTEEFIQEFQRVHRVEAKIVIMNIDTREGSANASLYDVVQYPAILATLDDGTAIKLWQGAPFPLMDEVAGYLR